MLRRSQRLFCLHRRSGLSGGQRDSWRAPAGHLASSHPPPSRFGPAAAVAAAASPWTRGTPQQELQPQRQRQRAAATAAQRRPWARWEADDERPLPVPDGATGAAAPPAEMVLATIEEDDVVLDTPAALLGTAAAAAELLRHTKARQQGQKERPAAPLPEEAAYQHPASRGVGADVIHLVTDAFRQQREAEVARRRELLYELTHPNPLHYTYGRKLVPPPPLSFGEVTPEAQALGRRLMVDQTYSLVRRATTRKSDEALLQPRPSDAAAAPMIEVRVNNDTGAKGRAATRPRYRGRAREDNAFRDHNYFFEINELYQEVVLVGRACAGKSSLLNGLLQQQVAKTSSTPNTTRAIHFYQSVSPEALAEYHKHHHAEQLVKLPGGGLQLTFVDVPGYGITGMSDQWRDAAIELTDAYFGVRRSVNTVLFCLDCDKGLTKIDLKYFQWLENVQGVFYIVLTKCDSVPHSRVCAVMRQVYELITKNRRKYRKVFPFVIPTSARDGTNMDVLRGLITETSGMIPGDKLRDLLHTKQQEVLQRALHDEAGRLAAVRRLEREQARAHYLAAHPEAAAAAVATGEADAPAALPPPSDAARYRLSLSDPAEGAAAAPAAGEADRHSRTRDFLRWRAAHPLQRQRTPYSDTPFRLNTGVERPEDDFLHLAYEQPSRVGGGEAAAAAAAAGVPPPDAATEAAAPAVEAPKVGAAASRVKGLAPAGDAPTTTTAGAAAAGAPRGGAVSQFLDTLEQFGQQTNRSHRRPAARRGGSAAAQGGSPALLALNAEGRLAAHRAGRAVGPALVAPAVDEDTRQAAWRAAQLKQMLQEENREAPWRALPSLARRLDEAKAQTVLRRRMSRKDRESYLRHSGKVVASFEKFEGEVHSAKYMNEVRVTKTARSQAQMHLNASAKINYRSMPTGLWKQYGKQDTYWPTPRVRGRENDESHRPGP